MYFCLKIVNFIRDFILFQRLIAFLLVFYKIYFNERKLEFRFHI